MPSEDVRLFWSSLLPPSSPKSSIWAELFLMTKSKFQWKSQNIYENFTKKTIGNWKFTRKAKFLRELKLDVASMREFWNDEIYFVILTFAKFQLYFFIGIDQLLKIRLNLFLLLWKGLELISKMLLKTITAVIEWIKAWNLILRFFFLNIHMKVKSTVFFWSAHIFWKKLEMTTVFWTISPSPLYSF